MRTNKKVNFKSLRILTYTVLIKTVIDTVILLSRLTESYVLQAIAQEAEFINIVACALCLGGIAALSGKFVTVHRIMVIVLILDCITLLLITFELRMIMSDYAEAAAGFESLVVGLYTAERLLIGAAFLFFVKGFGEALRIEGDSAAAEVFERLGALYLCFSSVGAVMAAFAVTTEGIPFKVASTVFEIAGIAIEFLIYRKASYAARLIWMKRAAVISDERIRLP